jgi:hypothetical protein
MLGYIEQSVERSAVPRRTAARSAIRQPLRAYPSQRRFAWNSGQYTGFTPSSDQDRIEAFSLRLTTRAA